MQQFATCVSCDAEIEQCLINASNDGLGYMDAPDSNAKQSQNIIKASFCGSFWSLVQWLQALFMQEIADVTEWALVVRFCPSRGYTRSSEQNISGMVWTLSVALCGRLWPRAHAQFGYSRDCAHLSGMYVRLRRNSLVITCASGMGATKLSMFVKLERETLYWWILCWAFCHCIWWLYGTGRRKRGRIQACNLTICYRCGLLRMKRRFHSRLQAAVLPRIPSHAAQVEAFHEGEYCSRACIVFEVSRRGNLLCASCANASFQSRSQ